MLRPIQLLSGGIIFIDYEKIDYKTAHMLYTPYDPAVQRRANELTAKRIRALPLEIQQQIIYHWLESDFPITITEAPRITTPNGRPLQQPDRLDLAPTDHIRYMQQTTPPSALHSLTSMYPTLFPPHLLSNGIHLRPRPLRHELPPQLSLKHETLANTLKILHKGLSRDPSIVRMLLQPLQRLKSSLRKVDAQLRNLQKKMLQTALLHPEDRYARAVPCECPIPFHCSFRAGDEGFEAEDEGCDIRLKEICGGADPNNDVFSGAGDFSQRWSEAEMMVWVAGCQVHWWRYLVRLRKEVREAVTSCRWYEGEIEAAGMVKGRVRKVRFAHGG